ncbi:MAG: 2'-5' RNA ligase family protein [bacterium]|nr:2'-5' RNA ligase family protein [bacterium]
MELVLNVKIPNEIVREMDVCRKKYHPSKLSHSHAHITLVPPFILKGRLPDLIKDIGDVLKHQMSLRMNINGLSSFDDDVIFFRPSCPSRLKKLRLILKKIIRIKYRKGGHDKYWMITAYHPHITIAHDKPENIKRYKKELNGMKYKRQFDVNGVNLYVRGGDKRWILKKELLFGRLGPNAL